MPFFILAGNLMNSAGITNRIYDFAVALAGWMRGGLAHVNIIGSVIFAGMSGTAIADAAGLGTIEIKAMKDHGYDTEFSVGVTAASSTLGPIIPPSLPFVIYGMMANVSIGALFLGGVIPGAVMTIFMMLYVYYCARRYNMGRDQVFRWKVLALSFVAAFPALLTPAIIIGGMTFGWFTPTEAAIAACAWAMILGIFLYRTMSLKQFYKVTMDTIETTAGVLLIVGAASLFGWVLTTTRVTEYATEALLSVTDNRYVILLLANVVLLVVGCFLEPIASISILVPVLMPVIAKVGIDPVHFGVMMTLNLMIGLLHPPLGMVLFVLVAHRQAVARADHHGDPALADPAADVAARDHADPGADAVAAAGGRIGEIAGRLGRLRRSSNDDAGTANAERFPTGNARAGGGRLGRRNMLVYGFVSSKKNKNTRRYETRHSKGEKLDALRNDTAIRDQDRGPRHHGTHRRTLCPGRSCRRQAVDRLLGSLGPGRQRHLDGARQRMGREGKGRSPDRLHPVAGQQEPADHRGRSAGALRPRHPRDADLVAAGPCQEPRAGRRHHGAADQAERRRERHRRISRQAPTATGSRCRRRSAARSRDRARAST